jgi:thioredoxin
VASRFAQPNNRHININQAIQTETGALTLLHSGFGYCSLRNPMSIDNFYEKLRSSPNPVVVDFWAPWCGPCRAIAPVVEKLNQEFSGRVDVWKVNADLEPDLLRSLRIYGIPTLIAFHAGQEIGRRTGVASARDLHSLFEAALSGNRPVRVEPAPVNRILRLGVGMALVGLAILSGMSVVNWLFAGIGGLIMFSGAYDRCPIYRMVSTRLKEVIRKNPASISDNNLQ